MLFCLSVCVGYVWDVWAAAAAFVACLHNEYNATRERQRVALQNARMRHLGWAESMYALWSLGLGTAILRRCVTVCLILMHAICTYPCAKSCA